MYSINVGDDEENDFSDTRRRWENFQFYSKIDPSALEKALLFGLNMLSDMKELYICDPPNCIGINTFC